MADRNWVVFVVALVAWALFFYLIDRSVMNAQGLPVGPGLMPR